jgi:hypothetical protein
MVSAFDLVVGVAARTVVAAPERVNEFQPFVDHAFHDAVGPDLVFDAGPDLIAITYWNLWSTAFWPGANEQSRIIAVREDTKVVLEALKSLA